MIKIKGTIEVFAIRDGLWTPVTVIHNKIVDGGYDAIAKAVAGDADYVVNGMYARFTNGVALEPVIADDLVAADYQSLGTDEGFVRFKTLTTPEYTTSDEDVYANNIATFVGVAGDTAEVSGASLIDGVSNFIDLALVAIPDFTTVATDTVVSAGVIVDRHGDFTPLAKIANSQCGFRWSLKFERT